MGKAKSMTIKLFEAGASDLLTDAAEWRGGYISRLEKRYGCELRFSRIDGEASRKLGRREGEYCSVRGGDATRALAHAMRRMSGARKILVAGLGSDRFVADALGGKTIEALRRLGQTCAITTLRPEVKAATGIDTAELVAAVAAKTQPELVIAADALATTDWRNVGACYQLTTAGIRPGSGTGAGGRCVDGELIGTSVLAVGVPLICSVRTEDGLRQVIPYDAESVVTQCANTIAAAIFAAYS